MSKLPTDAMVEAAPKDDPRNAVVTPELSYMTVLNPAPDASPSRQPTGKYVIMDSEAIENALVAPRDEASNNEDIAQSLSAMVIEWVEGGINFGTDWRSGLADVIKKRLARFTRASDDAREIATAIRGAKKK